MATSSTPESPAVAPPSWSLQRRLTRALGLALVTLWLIASALAIAVAFRAGEADVDLHLEQTAGFLASLLTQQIDAGGGDVSAVGGLGSGAFPRFEIAVWDRHGRRLAGAAQHAFPGLAPLPTLRDERRDGSPWRVYTRTAARGALVVQIAEPAARRLRRGRELALSFALGALGLLGASVLIVRLVARRVLRPIAELSAQIGRRGPADLRGLTTTALPSELAPIVDDLNDLLAQLSVAFRRERVFAATAAHELRTPLSAARLNAQMLRGAGVDPAILDDLLAAIDRAVHLLGQLTALSRIDSGELAHDWTQRLPLDRLVEETLGQLRGQADAAGVQLIGRAPEQSASLPGQAAYMLLRNLVENAIEASPRGGRVEVDAGCDEARCAFEVRDQGPGLPAAQRQRLLGRDPDLALGDGGGGGLGLSIVRRLAGQLGARVECRAGTGARGTTIRIIFDRRPVP